MLLLEYEVEDNYYSKEISTQFTFVLFQVEYLEEGVFSICHIRDRHYTYYIELGKAEALLTSRYNLSVRQILDKLSQHPTLLTPDRRSYLQKVDLNLNHSFLTDLATRWLTSSSAYLREFAKLLQLEILNDQNYLNKEH